MNDNLPIALAPVIPLETSIAKILKQGGPKPAPKPTYPLLHIDQKAIAHRYVAELLDAEAVEQIQAALDLVAVEQKHIANHNVPACAQKLTEANRAYSANPTKENLRLVREAKSLDSWDHGRIQLEAISRQKKIILSELSPLVPPLLLRCADFLDGDACAIESIDAENFKNFGVLVPVHPLAQSLHCTATALRTQAEHAGRSTEKSEFLEHLLVAWRDTSRPKPNLITAKIFMPPAPVESAPVVEAGEVGAVAVE